MKTNFKAAALLAAGFLFVSAINAQPPAPDREKAPGGKGIPPHEQTLQEVVAFSGKVVKMYANDDYVYDGFYMLTGGDSLLVKFPAHLGSQITKWASVGSSVTVNGVTRISPAGQKEIRMVSLTAGGQTINDALPAISVTPVADISLSGSGTVTSLQTDREGRTHGFIVNSNLILHIPPHVSDQLERLIKTGATISYTGNKKQLHTGEVAAGDYTIVRCNTITVNGKQYLVQ